MCPSLAAVITADLESKISSHYKYSGILIFHTSKGNEHWFEKLGSLRYRGYSYRVQLRGRKWLLVRVYQEVKKSRV